MSPSPFHPDLRLSAAVLPRVGIGPCTLRLLRRLEPLQGRRRPPAGVAVEPVGAITVRLHEPPLGQVGTGPALLWIHGGGYLFGTPAQDDSICRYLARKLGILVAAVAYRKAPEHPYPTPLYDCHDALAWLAARPEVDPSRLAIGGASAGGGLAAALALLARERGQVRPAFQLLSYPMLDDRTALRTDLDERSFRLWNNASNRFGWQSYLGRPPGSPDIDSRAVPARQDDLSGLPPAWIGVGTCDLFHDEDLAYAERLRQAGVPCTLDVVEGAFHGFDSVSPRSGVTRRFREAQARALAAGLGVAGRPVSGSPSTWEPPASAGPTPAQRAPGQKTV